MDLISFGTTSPWFFEQSIDFKSSIPAIMIVK
jgi:hypothetical protein